MKTLFVMNNAVIFDVTVVVRITKWRRLPAAAFVVVDDEDLDLNHRGFSPPLLRDKPHSSEAFAFNNWETFIRPFQAELAAFRAPGDW